MLDRFAFIGGPGYLTWNGITFQLHEDWNVDDDVQEFDIKSNLQGKLGSGISDTMVKITAKPMAFTGGIAAMMAVLFPYQPSANGQLIFPSTDLPAVIQTRAGKSITFAAAAITKMPSVTFAPDKELLGEFELTCLVKNQTAQTDATSMVVVATSTYTEPSLTPLNLIYDLYTTAFGSTFTDIETTEEGVVFTPTVTLKPRKTSNRGTYNLMQEAVEANVSFTPEGWTEANWYDTLQRLDGTGVKRGAQRALFGDAFTVTGSASGMPTLSLPLAHFSKGGLLLGAGGRIKQVTLTADRKTTAGTLSALYALGVVA